MVLFTFFVIKRLNWPLSRITLVLALLINVVDFFTDAVAGEESLLGENQ